MKHTYIVASDELSEIKVVIRGQEYLFCLHDLYQEIRKLSKYNNDDPITWQDVYDTFWRILQEHSIDPVEE